jgi:starch phosphorylase
MLNQNKQKPRVAYFCMEFGLHEEFPIYSGGLGILAGDILKAAADGNYPLVGMGILWRQGYSVQTVLADGKLYDCYPENRYDFLKDTGVAVKVRIRGRQVKCKVWECTKYHNAPLYLLDANLPENEDRLITGQLYGWFGEERIAQEMILGIGGVRALKALGIEVDVYHFNDSHPVVAGVELIRTAMDESGLGFTEAWEQTRRRIVFTTHTPVVAGNEVHEHELLRYMGAYNGLTYGQMVKLGGEPFSMTAAGLRLSRKANAVAALHGETARGIWADLAGAAEIISITNGVHNGTWQDGMIAAAAVEPDLLWERHRRLKEEMLGQVYRRNGVRLKADVLTVGFARRMVPYKRGDLIFSDPERIAPLLHDGKLQLIFSGKTHPNDLDGKAIIVKLLEKARIYPDSVVFLQNYDMEIGKWLTRGCDVWLNNPVRPLEASGTSGMKAAMNGVLNLSIPDGWWPEGCVHGVTGWQIGDGKATGADRDRMDAEALYRVLIEEVLPTYYQNRTKWAEMMMAGIKMSQWKFSAARLVRDYYALLYRQPQRTKEEDTVH